MKKKALFLLIDAFRYDVLSDQDAAADIAPNMLRLVRRGIVRKCIANAQSTQFVLPSLFTQSYPLDYGGYNDGIRNRPRSYVEILKEAGYETQILSNGNQVGVTTGYDRGFDRVKVATDYRTMLEQRISRNLSYEISLWREGNISRGDMITKVQKDFGFLLKQLEEGIRDHDKSLWTQALHRINERVTRGCAAERKLLSDQPDLVIDKLERVPAGVYWRFLGRQSAGRASLFIARVKAAITLRLTRWATSRWWFPFLLVGHYQIKCHEMIDSINEYVAASRDKSWYVYMHLMDVHDCRCLNRPVHMLRRMSYLPRWWRAKWRGSTSRRWTYDTAVMYLDDCIGRLVDTLSATGQLDDTAIVITGDHGFEYAFSPRKKKHVAMRTYREDIEVPMVLVCKFNDQALQQLGHDHKLVDSMGLCATFLELLGVEADQTFKGISVFKGGREAVISEHAGSGNADIVRRDLYFTVTTASKKLMTVLRGNILHLLHLYDLVADPNEQNDLLVGDYDPDVVRNLVGFIKAERSEILTLRGAMDAVNREEWMIDS